MPAPFPDEPVALPSCALEPLRPSDAPELAARMAAIDPWKTLGLGEPALTRHLTRADPALSRYAIRVDDRIQGVMALRHPWLRGPFLELLGVLVPRRGVGREVLGWAARAARPVAPALWTTVSDFNAPARAFYAAVGFREVAVLPDLVAKGRNEVLLRLELPPR